MKIAVIGSGISGLSIAWLLRATHQVVLYEKGSYLGGHTHTVDLCLDNICHPVDTGFLVHNELTYPNLIQLFRHLEVETYESDMSFSVQRPEQDLEWCGTGLKGVFGQRKNLLRPNFWWMLKDIVRFNAHAEPLLRQAEENHTTLGEVLAQGGYGNSFRDGYLVPMAAAIWSASPRDILNFPAATFLRFCLNHRLLQIKDRPQWRSIVGGGRSYVEKMAKGLDARLNTGVKAVKRDKDQVRILTDKDEETFDAVIFATHAPDTLAMLQEPSPREAAILGAVQYRDNLAILHRDRGFLPRREHLWAAWNYLSTGDDQRNVCVTYLLNKLQRLPFQQPVMVTLNPPPDQMPQGELQRFHYTHPQFDLNAIQAQAQLESIQGNNNSWFCGAWCGYGFHEDGLKSALKIIPDFGVEAPWTPRF
jgi:predicted NAD/FAD-binding protein